MSRIYRTRAPFLVVTVAVVTLTMWAAAGTGTARSRGRDYTDREFERKALAAEPSWRY